MGTQMQHRIMYNKLRQNSVPHFSSTERCNSPIPEPGDEEYWNPNDVDPIGNEVCSKKSKSCYFCHISYSQLGNRKQRQRHLNSAKNSTIRNKKIHINYNYN